MEYSDNRPCSECKSYNSLDGKCLKCYVLDPNEDECCFELRENGDMRKYVHYRDSMSDACHGCIRLHNRRVKEEYS